VIHTSQIVGMKANELARELLTARGAGDRTIPENQMSPLYIEASARIFSEMLEGAEKRDPDLVLRWGYLVHALTAAAVYGVRLASTLLADVNGIDNDEARDVVLAAIAAFMTEGQSNAWLRSQEGVEPPTF
jgi:hypothetical protein